jgi:Fur family ferric uptake transcriptional regulator
MCARPKRNTLQKRVILEEIKRMRNHPTAAELYEVVRRRVPRISLGTVYRNLEQLTQSGVIRKLSFSSAEARFDGDTERHYHVRCICCGRVDDVHDLPPGFAQGRASELSGYKIVGVRLEFVGICAECRTSRDEPATCGEPE